MIFILTELYYPEQTSTGYYLTHIAEALAQKREIVVITSLATSAFVPLANYPECETKNKVKILRCGGTSFDKNNLLGRIINGLTRSFLIWLKALKLCKKNDTLIVVTNPPLLPFIGLLLKWIKGIRLVTLIHDLYPEVLIATRLWKSNSLKVKVSQQFNRLLYQQSTQIITLGRDMSKRIYNYLNNKSTKQVTTISHWADLDDIYPYPKENNFFLKQLNLTDKFILLYSGNIGRTHDIESIVEVATHLKTYPNYHFIIAGTGYKKQWLSQTIQTAQLNNITLLDPFPREELNTLLNACDVAIISLIPNMEGVSVPSRIYNHIAAGKPLITLTDTSSEIAMLVTEHQIGWVVKPTDTKGLLKVIKLARKSPECCALMGRNAVKVAQTHFTLKQTIDAYQALLSKLENDEY
ncbi:MAG: glycosyltransferase family 4 protein [Microcystaceae cyanobacterium]